MSIIRVPEPQWPGAAPAPTRAAPEALPPARHQAEPDRLPPIDASSADSADEAACVRRLNQIAVVTDIPAIAGPGACGARDAVRIEGIKLRNGRVVELKPHAHLRCGFAEAAVRWLREDIAPTMNNLSSIMVAASYHCRGRNNIRGARLSQHGLGMALDVRAFRLNDGTEIEPSRAAAPRALRVKWREAACSRFSTVLGPGSDGYHEDHIHVDLTVRRRNHSMCRWAIPGADSPAVASAQAMPVWPRFTANATGRAGGSAALSAEKTVEPEAPPGTRNRYHRRRASRAEERANAREAAAQKRAESRNATSQQRNDATHSRRQSRRESRRRGY